MKLRKAVKEASFRSILCRENVQQRRRLIIEKELARSQPAVKVRIRVELASDEGARCAGGLDGILAGFIDENFSRGAEGDKPEWQQRIPLRREAEYRLVLEFLDNARLSGLELTAPNLLTYRQIEHVIQEFINH